MVQGHVVHSWESVQGGSSVYKAGRGGGGILPSFE